MSSMEGCDSKQKRSDTMARIRSKWTSPEIETHRYLKQKKAPHKMHPAIIGKPDMLLTSTNTAVFIDGCFWHGCKRHCRMPKTRRKYWVPKIECNKNRDASINRILKKRGYRVVRIWEHELKNMGRGGFTRLLRAASE